MFLTGRPSQRCAERVSKRHLKCQRRTPVYTPTFTRTVVSSTVSISLRGTHLRAEAALLQALTERAVPIQRARGSEDGGASLCESLGDRATEEISCACCDECDLAGQIEPIDAGRSSWCRHWPTRVSRSSADGAPGGRKTTRHKGGGCCGQASRRRTRLAVLRLHPGTGWACLGERARRVGTAGLSPSRPSRRGCIFL